ncbi:45349_t:CDS:2 [Gigaspora margarita]|uniref:45349_t:CDS:1 n=1 Tax=Gigaspora margarita TaxID=4874 RepID=A0ABN7VLJ2_GIGMA|nr:45349_t:CDS:2 [Gigaspora margarita]
MSRYSNFINPTPSIPNVPSSVKPAVSAVSSAIIDATNTAANTAANTAREIAMIAPDLLSELLRSFNNFKPKSPTTNFNHLKKAKGTKVNAVIGANDFL